MVALVGEIVSCQETGVSDELHFWKSNSSGEYKKMHNMLSQLPCASSDAVKALNLSAVCSFYESGCATSCDVSSHRF